ncbi:MAG TPA: hypothetical protein VGE08_04710 [Steroidobacter sp.]|uniref:hypothetical protein n=1 Tax=Steroidobacter sp. TaxID=1978227 RepID=UPI002ED9B041
MAANVLRMYPHSLFKAPERSKRRGRLPRGVANIKHYSRLKVGVLAEVAGSRDKPENDGIRVLITKFDPSSRHCWLAQSLDRKIRCSDGELDRFVWFKPEQLRRVWTGLSPNERLQLRLRRAAP